MSALALERRTRARLGWAAAGIGVVCVFLIVGVLVQVLAPAPSGPALSSFATTPGGVAGWAELLSRYGHPVRQLRQPLSRAHLPSDGTLVVLGTPTGLTAGDARAVAGFLRRGGWLLAGGVAAGYADGLPGHVVALPDVGFLENRELSQDANALRALQLAGPASRPVIFDETIHGFGPASGLAALPERWWFGLGALAIALGWWALSRAVRLGGADPPPPRPQWPPTAYVEAMADSLVRTSDRADLAERVKASSTRERSFQQSL